LGVLVTVLGVSQEVTQRSTRIKQLGNEFLTAKTPDSRTNPVLVTKAMHLYGLALRVLGLPMPGRGSDGLDQERAILLSNRSEALLRLGGLHNAALAKVGGFA
jgi:hypothetical protein